MFTAFGCSLMIMFNTTIVGFFCCVRVMPLRPSINPLSLSEGPQFLSFIRINLLLI